jgi:hypothetical protein
MKGIQGPEGPAGRDLTRHLADARRQFPDVAPGPEGIQFPACVRKVFLRHSPPGTDSVERPPRFHQGQARGDERSGVPDPLLDLGSGPALQNGPKNGGGVQVATIGEAWG